MNILSTILTIILVVGLIIAGFKGGYTFRKFAFGMAGVIALCYVVAMIPDLMEILMTYFDGQMDKYLSEALHMYQ